MKIKTFIYYFVLGAIISNIAYYSMNIYKGLTYLKDRENFIQRYTPESYLEEQNYFNVNYQLFDTFKEELLVSIATDEYILSIFSNNSYILIGYDIKTNSTLLIPFYYQGKPYTKLIYKVYYLQKHNRI